MTLHVFENDELEGHVLPNSETGGERQEGIEDESLEGVLEQVEEESEAQYHENEDAIEDDQEESDVGIEEGHGGHVVGEYAQHQQQEGDA